MKTKNNSFAQPLAFWTSLSAFIILFYDQELGFNLFIFTAILITWAFFYKKSAFFNGATLLYTFALLASSWSAGWFGDFFSIFFTIVLLLFYHSMLFDSEKKLIYAPFKTFWNNANVYLFFYSLPIFGNQSKNLLYQNKWFYFFFLPLFIGILFVILYSLINENFANLFIDLSFEFFDFGFFFTLIFGFLCLLPFWFYTKKHRFNSLFISKYTQEIYSEDTKENLVKNPSEVFSQSAKIVFIILSILLTLLLVFDIQSLLNLPSTIQKSSYSSFVHGGVNAVIFSIVCVILIILFYFQGKLNFSANKNVKMLAYVWLLLNVILIIFTLLKNKIYIENYGLTFKRLGVYAFLILCGVGLAFSFLKIAKQKTNYFVVNKMLWTLLIFFASISPINWAKIITQNNINGFKNGKFDLDVDYLYSIGPFNYAELKQFEKEASTLPSKKKINKIEYLDYSANSKIQAEKKEDIRSANLFFYFVEE